jgi:hypothetical protein
MDLLLRSFKLNAAWRTTQIAARTSRHAGSPSAGVKVLSTGDPVSWLCMALYATALARPRVGTLAGATKAGRGRREQLGVPMKR